MLSALPFMQGFSLEAIGELEFRGVQGVVPKQSPEILLS